MPISTYKRRELPVPFEDGSAVDGRLFTSSAPSTPLEEELLNPQHSGEDQLANRVAQAKLEAAAGSFICEPVADRMNNGENILDIIPDEVLDIIKNQLDITSYISFSTTCKKASANYRNDIFLTQRRFSKGNEDTRSSRSRFTQGALNINQIQTETKHYEGLIKLLCDENPLLPNEILYPFKVEDRPFGRESTSNSVVSISDAIINESRNQSRNLGVFNNLAVLQEYSDVLSFLAIINNLPEDLLGLLKTDLPEYDDEDKLRYIFRLESFFLEKLCDESTKEAREKITELAFNNLNLTTVANDVFSFFPNLFQLDLYNNKITELPEGIFDSLAQLRWLFLKNNEITDLPEGIFDSLVHLRRLDLNNNEITDLPEGIFDSLVQLQSLVLSNNKITELPVGIFDSLAQLQCLYLFDNKITELPEGIFDSLAGLRRLTLKYNHITELRNDVYMRLTQVEELDLNINEMAIVNGQNRIEDTADDLLNFESIFMMLTSSIVSFIEKVFHFFTFGIFRSNNTQ